MKVSVILPIYNVERYIEACVESIITQTHKDLELIIVNDQSPDSSLALAKQVLLKNNFRNFTIIEHPKNQGLAVSRNTGLAAATSDYVLFIDSDDTMEPTMLAELVSIVDQHGVDIAVCNFWRIPLDVSQPRQACDYTFTGSVDGLTAVQALLEFKDKAYVWTNLYKKSLFTNIKFAENVYWEDGLIQPMLWKEARQLYFHQNHLYNYFQRSGSNTARLGKLHFYLDQPEHFKAMEENFFNDARVGPSLRTSLLVYTHTWIRNLALTVSSAGLPYNELKATLGKYSGYLNFANILKVSTGSNKKLGLFLALLKLSPYLYWKRFSSQILAR